MKKLPPFCSNCDIEGDDLWRQEKRQIEQIYRGETFWVEVTLAVCKNCGTPVSILDFEKAFQYIREEYQKRKQCKAKKNQKEVK